MFTKSRWQKKKLPLKAVMCRNLLRFKTSSDARFAGDTATPALW
ncbi:hypothetical protein HanRHA438_Chr09g0391821 [Helianthus annuus]|nr:hypothetical protein HanRHA438_Chr09g0391821 [Helianthus annuus]